MTSSSGEWPTWPCGASWISPSSRPRRSSVSPARRAPDRSRPSWCSARGTTAPRTREPVLDEGRDPGLQILLDLGRPILVEVTGRHLIVDLRVDRVDHIGDDLVDIDALGLRDVGQRLT